MKTRIALIILGILDICFCCSQFTNNSTDAEHKLCSINFFRRKRSIEDYTRWRGNIEATSEFIVKVFDEEISTVKSKNVVAINILPVTRGKEKIIVGGVVIPSTTVEIEPITPPIKDYTRFVPPTTIPASHTKDTYSMTPRIGKINEDGIMPTPVFYGPIKNPKPIVKQNSQRDESPPASPQFLSKTPNLSLQYAPLTPVMFTRRFTPSPVMPPTKKSVNPPTRTIPHAAPTRTTLQKLRDFNYQFFADTTAREMPTRTSTVDIPTKTTPSYKDTVYNVEIDHKGDIAKKNFILNDLYENRDQILEENVNEKEQDYNQIFYSDSYGADDKTEVKGDGKGKYSEDGNNIADLRIKMSTNKALYPPFAFTSVLKQNVPVWETTTETREYDNLDDESLRKSPKRIFGTTRREDSNSLSQEKETVIKRNLCNLLKQRPLNFHSPRTLYEIKSQLKHWADESPMAKLIDITDGNLTTMENPIYMMVVDDPSSGQIISAKQTVMIVAGIQGRDHHAVTSAIYLLYQLIERSEANVDLLSKYRFWVIPVFNPDGYDYSMTFPHHRDWSKNLRQNWDLCKGRASCQACENYGLRCTIQACYGVSLDRNFEYQWIPPEELRSEHPCGDLYAGARQLSEPETRALTTFLHEKWTPINTFIAFKEGNVLGVMYPYSHTKKKRTLDHIYRQRATRAAAAAYSISGRLYVAGQTSEFLPLFAGGIEDWVDGHLGVDHTYTIMMYQPTDAYNIKFATERIVHEAFAAADTLLLQPTEVETLAPPPIKLVSNSARKQSGQLVMIFHTLICFVIVSS